MVDCLPLGDVNIIYKEDSRYAMQYIGGEAVFRFTKLPGADGLFAIGCVVDTPLGHDYMNRSLEILLHSGGASKNISAGRIKIENSFSAYRRSFLAVDYDNTEVWVCFPDDNSTLPGLCNRVHMWNWVEDTWGTREMPANKYLSYGSNGSLGTKAAGSRINEGLVLSASTSQLAVAEASATDFGSTYTSYVERTGLDIDEPDMAKTLQRSRWNFDGVSGEVFSISHGSAMTADAAPTYQTAANYTLGTTDYVNSRAISGKYLAVKVSWASTSSSAPGRVRSTDLDVTPGGKR